MDTVRLDDDDGADRPWYLWLSVLCLDAPLIAVLWQFFWAKCYHISYGFSVSMVLGLVTWAIYIFDRRFDSKKSKFQWSCHLFQRTRGGFYLRVAGIVALCVSVWLSLFVLPEIILSLGFLISGIVLVYLVFVQVVPIEKFPALGVLKDFLVGLIFAIGVIAPLAVYDNFMKSADYMLTGFVLLCFLNCYLIGSMGEKEKKHRDLKVLVWVAFFVSIWWCFQSSNVLLAVAISLSAFFMACIVTLAKGCSDELNRVLLDLALCTPLILIWFS